MKIKDILKVMILTLIYGNIWDIIELYKAILNSGSWIYYNEREERELKEIREKHKKHLIESGIKIE